MAASAPTERVGSRALFITVTLSQVYLCIEVAPSVHKAPLFEHTQGDQLCLGVTVCASPEHGPGLRHRGPVLTCVMS